MEKKKTKKETTKLFKGIDKSRKKNKKKYNTKNIILIAIVTLGIAFATLVLSFGLYIIFTSPDFDPEKLYNKEASVLYFANGETLTRLGSENRVKVSYNDLPEVFIDALIATEDSRFFQHNGFDFARFMKASLGQFAGNSGAGGASTLTMQVVKNNYTSAEASGIEGVVRKFTDIYMAVFKIEKKYTKEEVIEFYVNSQWFASGGTNYGSISGVEQASQYFFGKSIKDLNLSEAAVIAGMFQNPSYYNPYAYTSNAEGRRNTVLDLMYRHGYITEQERDDAKSVAIESLLKERDTTVSNNPYQAFIDYVINDVKEKTGIYAYTTPVEIYTTLDKNIQDVVNGVQNDYKFKDTKTQVGIAVTSVENGAILALGGGRNYVAQGLNRSIVRRQPGSTAKPIFDYGPLIEYTGAGTGTLFIDKPYSYSNGQSIKNWDSKYYGMITLTKALSDSRNIPALQAFQKVSNKVADFVHSLGIDYGENLYESASIGGFTGISPLESSAAYAAFARGGYYIEPYSFTKVVYLEAEGEYDNKYTKERVMSETTAYLITDSLTDATSSNVNFKVSGTQLATKTGTTNIDGTIASQFGMSSDATPDHWTNTYSSEYSISLWTGYDSLSKDGYYTSNSGTAARKSMMSTLANGIYSKNKTFTKPSGIVEVTLEWDTIPSKLASEYTPDNLKYTSLFKSGTEPSEVSTRFSKLNAPTNIRSEISSGNVILSWDPIATPEAIDNNKLSSYFNDNYGVFATTYYNERLTYNNNYIGANGYQVYQKMADGSLKEIGFTLNNHFTITPDGSASTYTYVVKSAYQLYKSNMSEGIETKVTTGISPELTLSLNETNPFCIVNGGIYSPINNPVKVMYNGTDVTSLSTITESEAINTSTNGNYTVTYNVTYNNGTVNKTKSITRTVKIADTCP